MKKVVEFTTKMLNDQQNTLTICDVKVDGEDAVLGIKDDSTGIGNHIAVATDVLTDEDFPVGTRFKVTIETE